MPKGIKETSGLITISAALQESGVSTFTSDRVDLQLNPLDNEVFVVYGIDLDVSPADLLPATTCQVSASVSTTERSSVGGINAPNVLAAAKITTVDNGVTAVTNEFRSDSAPATMLEYLGIIATNDFYLNIEGANNNNAKTVNARLYGVRGTASASIYAALVQSELLS
jgi:hypothetical protein